MGTTQIYCERFLYCFLLPVFQVRLVRVIGDCQCGHPFLSLLLHVCIDRWHQLFHSWGIDFRVIPVDFGVRVRRDGHGIALAGVACLLILRLKKWLNHMHSLPSLHLIHIPPLPNFNHNKSKTGSNSITFADRSSGTVGCGTARSKGQPLFDPDENSFEFDTTTTIYVPFRTN